MDHVTLLVPPGLGMKALSDCSLGGCVDVLSQVFGASDCVRTAFAHRRAHKHTQASVTCAACI